MHLWVVIMRFIPVHGLKSVAKVHVWADSSRQALEKVENADFAIQRDYASSPVAYAASRDADGIVDIQWTA